MISTKKDAKASPFISNTLEQFNNSNTNVYLDSTGKFSLGNKLSWNGVDTLSITGNLNVGSSDNEPGWKSWEGDGGKKSRRKQRKKIYLLH